MRSARFSPLYGLALTAVLLAPAASAAEINPNLPLPTLGGKQVWADEFFRADWRIQKNVLTGHYRLLDPNDVRRAWGSYEQCRATVPETPVPASGGGRLVILVHGLGRSAGMFDGLAAALRADGFETAAISYASTREGIDTHAGRLARLISRLGGVDEVSFVTHSMGGLVVRATLAHPLLADHRIRFRSLVMIAPPNQGSAIARALKDLAPYRWLTTEAGQDLTPGAARTLPVSPIDFAIVAGGLGDGEGFNPFLDGDDDGTVTVAETRLAGARDFLVVPRLHSWVDNHPATLKAVRNFLACQRFSCSEDRPQASFLSSRERPTRPTDPIRDPKGAR